MLACYNPAMETQTFNRFDEVNYISDIIELLNKGTLLAEHEGVYVTECQSDYIECRAGILDETGNTVIGGVVYITKNCNNFSDITSFDLTIAISEQFRGLGLSGQLIKSLKVTAASLFTDKKIELVADVIARGEEKKRLGMSLIKNGFIQTAHGDMPSFKLTIGE